MIYLKNIETNEVLCFDSNVDVSEYIDINNHREMTEEEIELHLNPTLTAEQIRAEMPSLTKRQFNLYLYDHNFYEQVTQLLESNPRFKIEFDSVSEIERLSSTVLTMTDLLNWTHEQVDTMWQEALSL